MKKLIVISDWIVDPAYRQSLKTIVEGFVDSPQQVRIQAVTTTASSLHAAFLTQFVAQQEEQFGVPLETVMLQDLRITHDFDSLFVLRLKSGLSILSTNIGHSLSLVKSEIQVVMKYKDIQSDHFPSPLVMLGRSVANFLEYEKTSLDLDEAHTNLIPQTDGYFVGHIDSFGNIITTLTAEMLNEKYNYLDQIPFRIGSLHIRPTFQKEYMPTLKQAQLVESIFGLPDSKYLMICGMGHDKVSPGDIIVFG